MRVARAVSPAIVVQALGLHPGSIRTDLKVISGKYPLDGGQGLALRRALSPPPASL